MRYKLPVSVAAICTAVLTAVVLFRAPEAQATIPYSIVDARTQQPVGSDVVRLTNASESSTKISQKARSFAPQAIEVRVGQTLEILNDDDTVHNAYCAAPDFKYNAGAQQPGSSAKVVFSAKGTFQVRCAIHPKMVLTVTVSE